MTIFRHVGDGKCYTIEHLILDIHHLNRNAFTGIYAYPHYHKSSTIIFYNQSNQMCMDFVNNSFIKVSER